MIVVAGTTKHKATFKNKKGVDATNITGGEYKHVVLQFLAEGKRICTDKRVGVTHWYLQQARLTMAPHTRRHQGLLWMSGEHPIGIVWLTYFLIGLPTALTSAPLKMFGLMYNNKQTRLVARPLMGSQLQCKAPLQVSARATSTNCLIA